MIDDRLPIFNVGAGSQPQEEDGAELAFMTMPGEMASYSMPDLQVSINALQQANAILQQVQHLLETQSIGEMARAIEIKSLNAENQLLIDQLMGDGEVSILFAAPYHIRIQESVLAGVWRVQYLNSRNEVEQDHIEVGEIPSPVRQLTFSSNTVQAQLKTGDYPPGVNNAIPLLTELNEKVLQSELPNFIPHVINLTLLPQSDEDIALLAERLGVGPVTILSRGYGNCRVTSTTTRNVWWVRYFNSQDAIILNTLEVATVPQVVCAAKEDLEDSAERLREIREVYA